MSIRNMDAFIASLWDWGFLDECFYVNGRDLGIRVGDMDGMTERNGHFLLLEPKQEGVQIKNGQVRAHRAMVLQGWTVIYLWGPKNDPRQISVWYPHQTSPTRWKKTTVGEVQMVTRKWFLWADANGAMPDTVDLWRVEAA